MGIETCGFATLASSNTRHNLLAIWVLKPESYPLQAFLCPTQSTRYMGIETKVSHFISSTHNVTQSTRYMGIETLRL